MDSIQVVRCSWNHCFLKQKNQTENRLRTGSKTGALETEKREKIRYPDFISMTYSLRPANPVYVLFIFSFVSREMIIIEVGWNKNHDAAIF